MNHTSTEKEKSRDGSKVEYFIFKIKLLSICSSQTIVLLKKKMTLDSIGVVDTNFFYHVILLLSFKIRKKFWKQVTENKAQASKDVWSETNVMVTFQNIY